ncbi:MAG: DedA family protein [Gammaproteobacteria bacterium]|nr:DedA family protein [Gammaproteobacteria bacterium]
MFEKLYFWAIRFASQDRAPWYLVALSFFESFILPFPPPDVMLAPMSLAKPAKALKFATLALIASVLGGLVGYAIGAFLFDQVQPLILSWGYQGRFETVTGWFEIWGFWAVLIAGFSPVPYKIFTLSAGVLGLALIPFVLASIIGRGARFFLLAWCLSVFGPAIEKKLITYIESIGWVVVVALIVIAGFYYF